jgi:hypothetical protein
MTEILLIQYPLIISLEDDLTKITNGNGKSCTVSGQYKNFEKNEIYHFKVKK